MRPWRRVATGVGVIAFATTAFGGSVAASTAPDPLICADRHLLTEVLDGRDQQRQRAMGVTAGGELLELYMAVDGSWTILASTADGGACIIEDGKAGEAIPTDPKA